MLTSILRRQILFMRPMTEVRCSSSRQARQTGNDRSLANPFIQLLKRLHVGIIPVLKPRSTSAIPSRRILIPRRREFPYSLDFILHQIQMIKRKPLEPIIRLKVVHEGVPDIRLFGKQTFEIHIVRTGHERVEDVIHLGFEGVLGLCDSGPAEAV